MSSPSRDVTSAERGSEVGHVLTLPTRRARCERAQDHACADFGGAVSFDEVTAGGWCTPTAATPFGRGQGRAQRTNTLTQTLIHTQAHTDKQTQTLHMIHKF